MPLASLNAGCLDDNAVADFVGGRLQDDALALVEAHLAQCSTCRAIVGGAAERGSGVDAGQAQASLHEGDGDQLGRGARVGRYEVIEWIGAGAMGTVYAAHDPALDRKVALKLIRAEIAGPDLETRLLREAKAMARLSRAEVVAVYDAGRHGDRLFIAMEFVEGGTLRQWLEAAPRTWREILSIYLRAARGLAQAHAAGIVHRDFKPDNVMVGDDGAVRVTDFGLARATREVSAESDGGPVDFEAMTVDASLTRSGAIVGTPVYMAPEQLAGRVADARSDVYGFCVSLYESLYAERPFAARTLKDLVAEKSSGELRPAPTGAMVPQRIRRVLGRGLRVRPEDRHPSMGALIFALERAARRSKIPYVVGAAILAAAAIGALTVRPPSDSRGTGAASASIAPAASVALPLARCTSNRACVESHGGDAYVCRPSDGACVPIASDDCVAKYEPSDLASDDTVWIGAMFPTKGPSAAAFGTMNVEGADFARKEIAEATRSLTGSSASLRVRRVALVACDDSEDPMRAARHLVDDVGVPAILGFGSGQEIVDVAGSLLIGRGVLTIATVTPSPLVTRLPQPDGQPRMVWRTTFSLDDMANAVARMVPDFLEPRLGARPTRVALVRAESASALSFGEAFFKQLVFNRKTALQNGSDYREVALAVGAPTPSVIADVAARLVDASPSIVVLLGPPTATVPIVEAVEAGWNKPAAPRPTYVVSNAEIEPFAAFIGKSAERRRRFFAIASDSGSRANARFVQRYNDTHAKHVQVTLNPSSSYDAFYLLAYAAFALGDDVVTGAALARAFERLVPPGHPIEIGPTNLFDALKLLVAGGRIDLQAAASGLDFDLTTGEAPSDFAILCASVSADGRAGGEDIESGVVFRATKRRFEGTLHCP